MTATQVRDRLQTIGLECEDSEPVQFTYESVGEVDGVACDEEGVLIGTFSTVEPSRELLDDFSEVLLVGPNWVVSIATSMSPVSPEAAQRELGGSLVESEEDSKAYPESPAQR